MKVASLAFFVKDKDSPVYKTMVNIKIRHRKDNIHSYLWILGPVTLAKCLVKRMFLRGIRYLTIILEAYSLRPTNSDSVVALQSTTMFNNLNLHLTSLWASVTSLFSSSKYLNKVYALFLIIC